MRRPTGLILLAAALLSACGGTPKHTPWGESVAVEDVLDGTGYTTTLVLGDASVRLTATEESTVMWTEEGGTTLVYVEDPNGPAGYQRNGDGPWISIEEAAPVWPTALLVPSFADFLVGTGEAEEIESAGGLYRFRDGPLDLTTLSLGDGLYLDYWLDEDGHVVRWTIGTEPGSATIEWTIRPVEPADLEGVPGPADVAGT